MGANRSSFFYIIPLIYCPRIYTDRHGFMRDALPSRASGWDTRGVYEDVDEEG